MATYSVRLDIGQGHCYQARVSFPRGARPSRRQLEAAARADAVTAFGRQARGWKIIDICRIGR